ncbi:hypothetical protein OEA41_003774 [Lepraria neglecta]|uniref:Uncharacterized protein n=1 Tax=Lepraria neglecta TaxID=209136 RepID=A0AAD9Z5C3_9LECA|nr:hypothetical protein OEA41_003774 [Lepraria neglecta]
MASRSSAEKGESRAKTEDEALLTIPKTATHTAIPRAMKSKLDDPGWLAMEERARGNFDAYEKMLFMDRWGEEAENDNLEQNMATGETEGKDSFESRNNRDQSRYTRD